MRTNIKEGLFKHIVAMICSCIIGIIVFAIVQKHMMIEDSDYSFHAIRAIDIFQNGLLGVFRTVSYPIWTIGVKLFERIMHFTLFDVAAWTSVIFYLLTYWFIYYAFCKTLVPKYNNHVCAFFSAVLMVVQPISKAGLAFEIGWGRALINTWHNPANIVARLLGMIAICFLFRIIEYWEKEGKYSAILYSCFGMSLIMANLGKPSFSQMFIPAITIYFIAYCIYNKFKNFKFCFFLALSVVPSLLVLYLQAILSFGEENGGVEVAWFDVMSHFYSNIPLMLVSILAFPLSVIILDWKECLKDKKLHILCLMFLMAFIEYAALAEIGVRRYHGNFSWAFNLAVFYIWMYTLEKFLILWKREESGMKMMVSSILLVLHFWCGISYLWCQLGNTYLWF